MVRISLLSLFVLLGIVSKAQKQRIQLIDSHAIIQSGVALTEAEKYDEAIAEFSKVSVNDTNYAQALYEKSYTFSTKDQYDSAIVYGQKGILLKSEYISSFYLLLGSAYHDSGKYEEALKIYEEGIKKFPTDHRLVSNKGLSYYYLWKLNEASDCFQKAIQLNYFSKISHKMLGLLCLKQNQPTRGALSILTYLTINPQDNYAAGTIVALEKYLTENISYSPDSLVFTPNDDFQSTDLILNSHITFNKNYKLKSEFDFKVIRQCQAMLEKLPYDASSEDFWMKTYVPFFKEMWSKGYFENFTTYWLAGVQDKAKKKYEKNDNDIKKVADFANAAFKKIELNKTLNFNGKIGTYRVGTFDDHGIQAITSKYDESTKKVIGYTEYYHENYVLESSGIFNDNGEKIGLWKYFDQNGDLTQTVDYKLEDSLLQYKNYYSDGGVSSEGKEKNKLEDGLTTSYYIGGGKLSESKYIKGLKEGKSIDFFSNGAVEYEANFHNGNIEGTAKKYYSNGKIYSETTFKNNKEDGIFTSYHFDGKKNTTGHMLDNEAQGQWEYFDIKGNLINKISYKDNQKDGNSISFFPNGKVSFEGNFGKGEPVGSHKYYDEDGKIFTEEIYEKSLVKTVKCFDKSGKVVKENSRKGEYLNYEILYSNGSKKSEGKMNKKGYDGLLTEYYISGGKLSEKEYKDGELNGFAKEYFETGTKQSESEYKSGELSGYYTSFHENGKTSVEGWYVKGKPEGEWRYYFTNGGLKDNLYYKNGTIEGININYNPNGKIDRMNVVENGIVKSLSLYDSTGKVYSKIEMPHGNSNVSILNFNKKLIKEYTLKNGSKEGEEIIRNLDGKIVFIQTFNNDMLNGKSVTFFDNGSKKSESEYQNNQQHGLSKRYYDNGKLEYDAIFTYDMADSITHWYNYEGNLEATIHMYEDKKHGEYVYFGEDGKTPAYKLIYYHNHILSYTYLDKNGNWLPLKNVENGTFDIKAYYPNGKISYQGSYVKNQRSGSMKRFYMNGNLYAENNFVNGIYNGLQKECFINGKTRVLYYQKDDITVGLSTTYYDNGKVKLEENYEEGYYHGNVKEYDMNGKNTKTRKYYYGVEY